MSEEEEEDEEEIDKINEKKKQFYQDVDNEDFFWIKL